MTHSTRIASLLMLALVAGCGDDTTSASTQDLATAADMSVAPDLKMLTCANILACIAGCGQNLACQAACAQEGTTAARATFDAFAGCVAATCGPVDGGSDACTGPTDSSAGCQTCVSNTAANALNSGAPCNTEHAACAGS